MLTLTTITAAVGSRTVVRGIDLLLDPGSTHFLMGPNGSGKSSLAQVIMGSPEYTVTAGALDFNGQSILHLSPDERSRLGIFLAFQYPLAVPGVTGFTLLQEACRARFGHEFSSERFAHEVEQARALVGIEGGMLNRPFNEGFSGGERKRLEMLQLLVLRPKVAILDELDSGLDIDGLKLIAASLAYAKRLVPEMTILVITHYQHLLRYIRPDKVHVIQRGRVSFSGGVELIHHIEEFGYKDDGIKPAERIV